MLNTPSTVGKTAAGYVLLVLSCLLIYYPVTHHGFSVFDDPGYVKYNYHVLQGLNKESILWAFSEYRFMKNWHPLTWLSYMSDVSLFGPSAGAIHVVNVVFHLLNTFLVVRLALHFTANHLASFIVAFLFLVHPLHVESVAWISERKDVLSGFFFLAGLLAYFSYAARPSMVRYLWVALLFVLALLSKPMVVTFPLVLLLLDFWPLNRHREGNRKFNIGCLGPCAPFISLVIEKVPLLLLSLVSGIITIIAQGTAVNSLDSIRFSYRIFNAIVSYAEYLIATVLPIKLAVYYAIEPLNLYAQVLPYALVLAGITGFAFYKRKSHPYMLVGWCWFLITLLPVIGLLQVGSQARADRYMYLPSLGLFLVLGVIISRWSGDALKKRGVLFFIPAAGFYIFMSCLQVNYWGNPVALHLQALENGGESLHTRLNLASTYLELGMPKKAEKHALKAIELEPRHSIPYFFYGQAEFLNKNYPKSAELFRKSLEVDPENSLAWHNLGAAALNMGKREEAIKYYLRAYEIDPTLKPVRDILAALDVELPTRE